MIVSVIIPTFNRCSMLRQALDAVCKQSIPFDQYEIVVVDNASTDDTRETVAGLSKRTPANIRYVYETRPGLHWGRHAGARAAQGRILAFIDDDCLPESIWLESLVQAYAEFKPDAAGGKILIRWDQPPPSWVITYESVLGRIDLGTQTRFLTQRESIYGGNFSILRDRLFEIGGFNPDQVGDYLVGDGEIGLCRKIHEAGWKMLWVASAMVWHQQTIERNGNLRDLKRRFSNNGSATAYAHYREAKCSRGRLIRHCVKVSLEMLRHKTLSLLHYNNDGVLHNKYELITANYLAQALYYWRLIWSAELRLLVMRKDWITEGPPNR